MSRVLSGKSVQEYLAELSLLEESNPPDLTGKRLHQRACGGWYLMTDFEIEIYEIGLTLERKTCGSDGRKLRGPRI